MATDVVFEVALGHEATSASSKGANIGPFSRVDSHLRLQVALLAEPLVAPLMLTGKWLLLGLFFTSIRYMRAHVNLQARLPQEPFATIPALLRLPSGSLRLPLSPALSLLPLLLKKANGQATGLKEMGADELKHRQGKRVVGK